MSLHPHQRRALVAWLRQHRGSRTADEVYADLLADKNLGGLRLLSFVARSRFEQLPPRRRSLLTPIPDGEAAVFPAGVPGFPNKIRREWVEDAFKEVMGG